MAQAQATTGSKEWHAERRLGIGGSDCAAVLGLSKFKTPYQVYLEKIGEAEEQDETWEMAFGKTVEPLLRQHYADTTGREVRLMKKAIVHPKYDFMRYNPDGLTEDRLQEFKTAGYGKEWGEQSSDEVPQEYLLQVQHGMAVTQRPVADVTVSIMGRKPQYYVVEADKELQEMIIEEEAGFWAMVTSRTPPDPINNEDAARMFSRVNGQSIVALPEVQIVLLKLRGIRDDIKTLEQEKEGAEVAIKAFMGENEVLVDENMVPLCSWKQARAAERLDTKAVKENEPDVYEKYIKIGDPSRRFLVK